jgi:hypothetical protein
MNDDEIWKDIPGYEGHYQASNKGHIRSMKKYPPKILSQPLNGGGYASISLCLNGVQYKNSTHFFICLTFNGQPPSTASVVNHKDGNKTNNIPQNLEWVSPSENLSHGKRGGFILHRSKLTEEQVVDIYRALLKGESVISLAKQFNVDRHAITNIKYKYNWSYILKDFPPIYKKYPNQGVKYDKA